MQIAEVYLHDGPFPFCKTLKNGINSEIRAKHMISVTCLLENDQKVGIYGSHALRCVAAFFCPKITSAYYLEYVKVIIRKKDNSTIIPMKNFSF